MDDSLVPPQSAPPLRGNSREYLLQRLERDGHHELLALIDAKMLTVYAAACEVGYVTRPEPTGNGSPNARKRREWTIRKAYQASARVDAASVATPPNGRSAPTTPIDLAAALAEVEEMQRPPAPVTKPVTEPSVETLREREPAPAALPEPIHFPLHVAVPCTSCSRPEATAALREVLDVYVAARRGKPAEAGNVLPRACCRRQLSRRPDARAMIA
jgi:hypothetical protein